MTRDSSPPATTDHRRTRRRLELSLRPKSERARRQPTILMVDATVVRTILATDAAAGPVS
jgi:hypothetical protein